MTRQPLEHSEFHVDNPGALIAAIPAVLGFVPERSLVLISVEDGRLGAVMRADLSDDLTENIDRLADIAATSGAVRVVAVIIDEDGALCPMCHEDHQQLAVCLQAALTDHDVQLGAVHVVDRIANGGSWHCVDGCGVRGAVDDPGASPLAAAAVLDGRRLYSRRSDLQAVIAMSDAAGSSGRAAALHARRATRDKEWRADANGCGRRDVENAMAAADRLGSGAELDDREIATLACALTDVAVRDILYALAVGADSGPVEALWAMLARELPDPWRVDALVLLAFSAYARGDGPLAGLSLEAARRSDPQHRMARMLDTALQSGMRPEQIRELAATGYRLAAKLGVRLPPRTAFGRRAI